MSQFNISFRLDWPSEWADYFFRLKLKILTWYLSMVLFHFIGSNWKKWIQNIARGYLGYFGKVPLVDTKLEFFTSTEKSNSLIYSSNRVQNWYKNGAFLFLPRQSPGEPIILFEHLRTKIKILQFLTLAHILSLHQTWPWHKVSSVGGRIQATRKIWFWVSEIGF